MTVARTEISDIAEGLARYSLSKGSVVCISWEFLQEKLPGPSGSERI